MRLNLCAYYTCICALLFCIRMRLSVHVRTNVCYNVCTCVCIFIMFVRMCECVCERVCVCVCVLLRTLRDMTHADSAAISARTEGWQSGQKRECRRRSDIVCLPRWSQDMQAR